MNYICDKTNTIHKIVNDRYNSEYISAHYTCLNISIWFFNKFLEIVRKTTHKTPGSKEWHE